MNEFDIINTYFKAKSPSRPEVSLSIGDDGAIIQTSLNQDLVLTTDTLVEGQHFLPATPAAALGERALAVNLSDLSAMGATPSYCLLSLTLPKFDPEWLKAFSQSFLALAGRYQMQLVGGNMTRGPLSITVQALGLVPPGQALQRTGAQVGDLIYVTGTLGDAACGLNLAQHAPSPLNPDQTWLIDRYQRPTARVQAGIALRTLASSAIDISDGLAADLNHILTMSQVGAEVKVADVPLSAALRQQVQAEQALAYALSGGDDYELCFTIPPQRQAALSHAFASLDCPCTCIGTITAQPGLKLKTAQGQDYELKQTGYQHF